MSNRLLILTNESIGEMMAGPGIRAWEIARSVGKKGLKVTIASPYPTTRVSENVTTVQFSWDTPDTVREMISSADVLLTTGPMISRLVIWLGHGIDIPVIADLYNVSEIERIILSRQSQSSSESLMSTSCILNEMMIYLLQGDIFLFSVPRQYDYWLGALMAAGRVNAMTLSDSFALEDLLKIVPYGLQDRPKNKGAGLNLRERFPEIKSGDKVILWNGGMWEWMDPFTFIRALDIVFNHRKDIRVIMAGFSHFENGTEDEMAVSRDAKSALRERGWIGTYVFGLEWMPYDNRGDLLQEVDLGVSVSHGSIESMYAARARLVDFLWAGVPCVVTEGDHMALILQRSDLAMLVPPNDHDALSNAILSLVDARSLRRETLFERSRPMASSLVWDNIVNPIVEFVHHPRVARDRALLRGESMAVAGLRGEINRLGAIIEEQAAVLQVARDQIAEYDRFRSRRIIRTAERISQLYWKLIGSVRND